MTVKEKIYQILKDYIGIDYRNEQVFMEKYNEIREIKISDLGVDSVDFFNVVLNVEEVLNCNIDWNTIDPENFQTIEKLEKIIS